MFLLKYLKKCFDVTVKKHSTLFIMGKTLYMPQQLKIHHIYTHIYAHTHTSNNINEHKWCDIPAASETDCALTVMVD